MPCIAVGGGVLPEGIDALAAVGAVAVPVVERPLTLEEAIAAGSGPLERAGERIATLDRPHVSAVPRSGWRRVRGRRPRPRKRRFSDPGRELCEAAGALPARARGVRLSELAEHYGRPAWEPRLDPTSELVLTILTQNTADINAERAFERLREAYPSGLATEVHRPGAGWGGEGLPPGAPPDWHAVEYAPIPELMEVIRPGGLAYQKGPRIQATLRRIREERGDYSLEFLAEMTAAEARDWLTAIPGIGRKTASILLLFCYGMPLMPIDRHVERVSKRVGLLPPKAPSTRAMTCSSASSRTTGCTRRTSTSSRTAAGSATPATDHEICPLFERCRFVNPKAP